MTLEPRWDSGVALRISISTTQTAVFLYAPQRACGSAPPSTLLLEPIPRNLEHTSLFCYCCFFFLNKVWFSDGHFAEKKVSCGIRGKWMHANRKELDWKHEIWKYDWHLKDISDCEVKVILIPFVFIIFEDLVIVCICSYDGIAVEINVYSNTVITELLF